MKIRYWKTDPMIPDCPNPIILNLEMGGWGGKTIVDTTLPWTMHMDWVRVWEIEKPEASIHDTPLQTKFRKAAKSNYSLSQLLSYQKF